MLLHSSPRVNVSQDLYINRLYTGGSYRRGNYDTLPLGMRSSNDSPRDLGLSHGFSGFIHQPRPRGLGMSSRRLPSASPYLPVLQALIYLGLLALRDLKSSHASYPLRRLVPLPESLVHVSR